jgi:hypothetical protein
MLNVVRLRRSWSQHVDGRLEDLGLPPTTPLRPARLGRGLPVPPVVALVAVISALAGIALGYGMVPRPDPLPSSSPARTGVASVASPSPSGSAVSSVAPTPQPSPDAYEVPPAGGLTLSEALAALNRSGTALSKFGANIPESAVIYARAERWGPMPSLVAAPEQWVWAIAISNSFLARPSCGGSQPPQPCTSQATTMMVILNYNTGAYLEDWSPAFP